MQKSDLEPRSGRAPDEIALDETVVKVNGERFCDNVEVGAGTKGPVTDAIQTRFFDVVERRTDDYADWFTFARPFGVMGDDLPE